MSTPNNGRDLFTNLPLELLHEIAGYLPLHHRLKLRTVFSKALEDTVAELVGPILKTIYLSPSAHSICKFHRLLSSAFYRRQIRTVVYIPRTISRWRLERITYLHELDFTHNISLMEPLADWSYDLYKTTHDEHMEGDFSMFANYFLAADLAQLSRLSRLVVADGADVVGLNASRLWCGHAHVEERWRLGLSVLRKAAQGIAAERMLELRDDQMNDDAALHDTALFLAAEQGQMKPAVLTLDFPKN
ncbi:hypothetical protein CKM354_000094400 [Cercospora kikuchii]|uniref:F-box domain-containing protein n=1 Tax=Cercospora kikuchii TaxID=84275 RepID=A0A9P3FC63_9PEZI|nr:uncharacterized protein CKM354_000094400 [Cercospora kikuchii]GIZ37499.1 hypothetical protein CKM354_000094400 [Cercospora kikuchii]